MGSLLGQRLELFVHWRVQENRKLHSKIDKHIYMIIMIGSSKINILYDDFMGLASPLVTVTRAQRVAVVGGDSSRLGEWI